MMVRCFVGANCVRPLLFAAVAAVVMLAAGALSAQVYVAGHVGIGEEERATLWKDGVAQILNNQRSKATSVYASGRDVYVAGIIGSRAALWKNGALQALKVDSCISAENVYYFRGDVYAIGVDDCDEECRDFDGDCSKPIVVLKNGEQIHRDGYVRSVYPHGNNVYMAGRVEMYDPNVRGRYNPVSKATLWKNGESQTLPQSAGLGFINYSAEFVYVSNGDVYVAGNEYGIGGNDEAWRARLWKNGVTQGLEGDDENSYVNSIYVSGSDVYVAGFIGYDLNSNAAFWKNGVATTLHKEGISQANYIYVLGSDVYVAGYTGDYRERRAVLWKNGVVHTLSNMGSDALSVFVTQPSSTTKEAP